MNVFIVFIYNIYSQRTLKDIQYKTSTWALNYATKPIQMKKMRTVKKLNYKN